jgi:hypothetical protein
MLPQFAGTGRGSLDGLTGCVLIGLGLRLAAEQR